MKILIILGSTRPSRRSVGIGTWFATIASAYKEATFEIVDLADFPLPFYNEPVGAGMLESVGYTTKEAEAWAKKVEEADGYVIIAPEYNHGYPAVLKNALDYVYKAWNNKPIGFVSYGSAAGGSRSVEQLRLVAVELQMAPIRNQVVIPFILSALDDTGTLKDPDQHYLHAATAMIEQLLWWTKALKKAREER